MSETTGFFDNSSIDDFCYIDFEKEKVKYTDGIYTEDGQTYVQLMVGAFDKKLLAITTEFDYILIDEKFNTEQFINNKFDGAHTLPITTIDYIDKDKILQNTMLNSKGRKWPLIEIEYIDLNTKERVKLSSIANNGQEYFQTLYIDKNNVYIYNVNNEEEHRFIILDKETLEVKKEIPSKKEWVSEKYGGGLPYIIKN